jgi:hypothetical protein
MAADDPREEPPWGNRDWRPIPDPTSLTTAQLRRELSALREILTARLDAMDTATALLDETVNRTPTEIQKQISHLKELLETRLEAAEKLSQTRLHGIETHAADVEHALDNRFSAIAEQFKARDEKVEALAVTAAAQLRAALESADKLSQANSEAALLANSKTEAAFGEQIKSLADKIAVTTARLDRGEGSSAGSESYRTERRLDMGQVIAVVSVIVAVAAVVLYALKK